MQQMVGSVYLMLAQGKEQKMPAEDVPQNATNGFQWNRL